MKAMGNIGSDWSRCKKDLMKMIVDLELGNNIDNEIKHEEHKKLVSFITEYMSNMLMKLKDKSIQCRLSSEIVNISMPLYMRNKAASAELRVCNLVLLPNQDILKKKHNRDNYIF